MRLLNLIIILSISIFLFSLRVDPVFAQTQPSSTTETFTPEVPLPGVFEGTQQADDTLLSRYIRAIYIYFIWVVGIVATVMVIYGGIRWVGAAGNTSQLKEARDIVDNAVIGVIIALASVVLLNIINPKLSQLSLPGLGSIKTLTNVASHVCTGQELSLLAADKENFACGNMHTLRTKITVDPKTGLPASNGDSVFDVCITAGCSITSEVCALHPDTTDVAFTGGKCASTIPLQPQSDPRYASLSEVQIQNTQQSTDYTNCGIVIGTAGAVVGNSCPGNAGQCYSAASSVTIVPQGVLHIVPEFHCPKS